MKSASAQGHNEGPKPSKAENSPTVLLHEDHEKVKQLLSECEHASQPAEKWEIFETVAKELKIQWAVEKEILYPVVWVNTNADELVQQGADDHLVLDNLLGEIEKMRVLSKGNEADFSAKFNQLQLNITSHIETEEQMMFPKFEEAAIDKAAVAKSIRDRTNVLRQEQD